ncbi:S8 family serine peptidase [Candidatus Parcubacteria bacterium]|nr:S8 family serine peptidase [Candidatus Parcubacteria bacterium]
MTKNRLLITIALVFAGTFAAFAVYNTVSLRAEDPVISHVDNNAEIAGSIIITNKPEEIVGFAKSNGLGVQDVTRMSGSVPTFVVLAEKPDDPRVKALEKQKNVTAMPNYIYKASFTPNDSKYGEQWNLPKISAPKAWDISKGSSETTIAVIDSGILFSQTINGTVYSQPDFPQERQWVNTAETGMTQAGDTCWTGVPENKQANNCDDSGNDLVDDWRGWDFMAGYRGNDAGCPNNGDPATYESPTDSTFVMQDNDPQPYSCDSPTSPSILNKNHYDGTCQAFTSACFVGHGTMVASAAGAATDNSQLIAGLDHNAKLMSIRVLDGYGYGTTARLASAIHYAADNGADVINMSLGSSCSDESFSDPLIEGALKTAADAGAIMMAASGNGNLSTVCYPASSSLVMAIGATGSDDKRTSYSSYSNKLDVVAPAGVPVANAPSARINSNYYANAGGTSLSTPHVAGLAALIKGHKASLSRSDIMNLIRDRADKVGGMGGKMFHKEYGHGRINVYTPLAVLEGKMPVYRLYRPITGSHFYTTSTTERDTAANKHGYRYENVGFHVLNNEEPGTTPVYRLYRPITGSHFYTTSTTERDTAANKHGYRYENVGFHVLNNEEPGTTPVYRLYRPITGSHFYTTSTTERDTAANKHGYRYENVGFRAE